MDRWTDGQTDGHTEGQTEYRCTNRYTDKKCYIILLKILKLKVIVFVFCTICTAKNVDKKTSWPFFIFTNFYIKFLRICTQF